MSGYRVMVVDDDPVHLEVTREYLALGGYDVTTATGGHAALAAMAGSPPDLVLLDLQMPDLDGFATFQRMLDAPALHDVPVLFLSSLEAPHVKVRGLELGAEDYVIKGCAPSELLARVRAGLRRAARYRRLRAAVVGDLGPQVGLDTIVQTALIGMRAARVRLLDLPAEIDCARGAIVACRYATHRGGPALQRVFLQARGRFTIETGVEAVADEPQPGGLMDSLVAVDEALETLRAAAPPETILALAPAPVDPALERRRALFPLAAAALVALLDGDVRAAAAKVAGALREGQLVLVT